MKKIFFALTIMFATSVSFAQVTTPQSSPKSTIKQVVGLTDVEIEYSRPSAKGRTIFGDLVPFGKVWRTGANANTTISFSDDVIIDGKTLKKGKYALFTTPKSESWEIVFYSDTDNWGVPDNWNESNVVLRTNVKPETLSKKVETFTIEVENLDIDFAYLDLLWENTSVSLKFEVPTKKTAFSRIEKALAGPGAGDYFASAQYYHLTDHDLPIALSYINKALDLSPDKPFWYTRLKSLIQAKMGDKKAAIETAKISLEAAKIAKNNDYIKMNEDSIKEWSKK